jgi:microcystin-dependent protein
VAEPFLSELRLMSFEFAPKGWALANGQLMPINQNQALFSLLGTTFGGDGRVNFALPDLQGRTPIHVGNSHVVGEKGGEQAHTLSITEIPQHVHALNAASDNAAVDAPGGNLLATGANQYAPPPPNINLVPSSVGNAGGGQAHLNMQPFLTISFCIALVGIFPSPS